MPKTTAARSDNEADAWFENVDGEHRPLLVELREMILSTSPSLDEEIKWRQPCYKHRRHVCYLQNAKDHVVLGFQQGAHLPDPHDLLEGTGKDMRHVKIRTREDIKRAAFLDLVSAAIAIDDAKS